MKATSLKTAAILAGSIGLFAGSASAQTATTEVVGYETLSVISGFNYLGLRLHETPATNGTFDGSTDTSLTDSGGDFSGLDAGTLYVVELANGTVVEALGSSFAGGTLSGLSGITAADEGAYVVRPAASLESVFGAANESGLKPGGFGAAGADQVWLPDGAGDFNRYYYDATNPNTFMASWSEVAPPNNAITAGDVPIVYVDGVIIVRDAASTFTELVVSGDLKTGGTNYVVGNGFNYFSSVYPVGATLETQFGAANTAGLVPGGFGAAGADQVWLPDGAGDFNRYYYDATNPNTFAAAWSEVAPPNNAVDPTTVGLTSGMIIVGGPTSGNITTSAPGFYAGL